MLAPVLVTPPAMLPVSLEEAKLHLKVEGDEENTLITGLLQAAVSHLDGWTGILGRCLVEQTWRVSVDAFCREIPLLLAPIIEVASVTWRNADGQLSTVSDDEYLLEVDAGGNTSVRFRNSYAFPTGLYEAGAVSVTFKAGYPTTPAVAEDPDADPPVAAAPAVSTVPPALKVAILLMVGHWYANRETASDGGISEVPLAAQMLVSPFRRVNI